MALAAGSIRYLGAVWDVSWHRTLGRDTFWSAPHLLLYAGVALGVAVTLRAIFDAVVSPSVLRPYWQVRRARVPTAYLLAAIGSTVTLASAPFDDWWHSTFGRDVDVWSPPHLTAVAGAALGAIGWTLAVLAWRRAGATGRAADVALYAFLALLLYTGWFGLNWHAMAAASRDTLLYPALAALVFLPVLIAVARQGVSWAATLAAAAFMLAAALPMPALELLGWRAPAFPPLLVVPALVVDLVERRRFGAPFTVLLQGISFAPLLLAVEVVRFALVPAAAPRGLDLNAIGPHLAVAAAHPWTVWGVVESLPVLLPVGILAALLGRILGGVLMRAELAPVAPAATQAPMQLGGVRA